MTGLPSDDAVLRAVLEADGAGLGSVRRTTIGFSAVPSLVAGKVDAVVAFWNGEGVALRKRGVRTHELVLVTSKRMLRRRRALLDDTLAALRDGTEAALADPAATASELSQASGAEPELVRAELREITPALRPPLRLDRAALDGWARFDARFGILRGRPDVGEAFPTAPAR